MSELLLSRKLLPMLVILPAILFAPLSSSQGTLSITVSTDKSQYVPGETVAISGKVLDSHGNPVLGAGISIQVGDPPTYADVIFSDNSGSYVDSFVLQVGVAAGQYTVYATASKAGYDSAQQQTKFTVLPQAPTTTSTQPSSQPSSPSKCFIATATYGSEIAPEVALLRNFRDAEVMQTSAGRSFMLAFNAFYYSFSPQVASFIAFYGPVRSIMKVTLYPLIGILYVSSKIFQLSSFNRELAVTISGILAALGIGFVYLGPVAILGNRLVNNKASSGWQTCKRMVLASCLISTLLLVLVEASRLTVFLTGSAVAVVLSFLFLGAFCAKSFATLLGVGKKPQR